MSWGGQQPYGGYGQGPGYASAPPQQYGGQSGYQAPPGGAPGGYQQRPPGYGQQPPPQQYGGGYQQQQYGAPPPQQGGYGALPGYGAPPQQGYGAPYGGYGPPCPPGVHPDIWEKFRLVDQDNSGHINALELRQALTNVNWTPFNAETCRLMIGMFDKDRSGQIDVHEFAALWKYVQDWKSCFERFDQDRSGNIDSRELHTAFETFGYRLSPQFCDTVIRVFDRRGARNINFDDFIQACVMLKTLTDKFRSRDTQQNGMIRISYEDFLEMVLDNTLMNVK